MDPRSGRLQPPLVSEAAANARRGCTAGQPPQRLGRTAADPTVLRYGQTISNPAHPAVTAATPVLDLTDFKRDLSELTDRLGNAQDCL